MLLQNRKKIMSEGKLEVQILKCADCGIEFEFSVDDQEYYASKGYSTPKRCPECRQAKKNASRGGNRGNDRRGERQQYPAICSACGCDTTVPFKPSGERPVLCADCYKKNRQY